MELNTTNSTSANTAEAPPTLKHGAKAAFLYYIYLTRGVLAIGMAVITSFSNGLVIFLVVRDPKKNLRSSPTCLLVASLALVDLAVGCGLEPTDALYSLAIANRKKPSLDRKDLQSAAAFLLLSSTVLVMLITFDRHTAVSRPIQYPYSITKKRITISVVLVWVYCAILIVAIRRWGKELRNILFCAHIDLVLFLTTGLFCRIVYVLRQQTNMLKRLSVSLNGTFVVQASARERKVTLTLATMLVVFLFCTMPWFIMMQIYDYCQICQKYWWIMKLLFILFEANCAINPFLCTFRLPRYRAALRLTLTQWGFSRVICQSSQRARRAYVLKQKRLSSGNHLCGKKSLQIQVLLCRRLWLTMNKMLTKIKTNLKYNYEGNFKPLRRS